MGVAGVTLLGWEAVQPFSFIGAILLVIKGSFTVAIPSKRCQCNEMMSLVAAFALAPRTYTNTSKNSTHAQKSPCGNIMPQYRGFLFMIRKDFFQRATKF